MSLWRRTPGLWHHHLAPQKCQMESPLLLHCSPHSLRFDDFLRSRLQQLYPLVSEDGSLYHYTVRSLSSPPVLLPQSHLFQPPSPFFLSGLPLGHRLGVVPLFYDRRTSLGHGKRSDWVPLWLRPFSPDSADAGALEKERQTNGSERQTEIERTKAQPRATERACENGKSRITDALRWRKQML